MMRVLIDATGITRKKAGVGVYGKNLIDRLVAAGGMELFLVVQDDDPDLDYYGVTNVTVLRMSSRLLRNVALRLLFEQTVLPLLILKHRIDVVHSLHYSFPLFRFGAKSVVTIHDLTSLLMPDMHIGIKMHYYRFFIRRARRWSDALIFVSRSAQEDFLAHFGSPRGLSTVVYHGKSPVFHPQHDQAAIDVVRATYGVPARYILYVGTIEPRKNLERLVQAFANLASTYPEVSLVIAGMMGWKQDHLFGLVRDLGLKDRVLFPGFVAEEHKALLIAGSNLFVYPSNYEGFGLPVLEALASGIPTVTSNLSSLPEVAGGAALLVDPKDTAALAGAMGAIFSDLVLAAKLRREGPKQAAKFTWENTAEQTTAIYRALAHS
jgi:glycosyltransferase involved in cell wall biosynthesis